MPQSATSQRQIEGIRLTEVLAQRRGQADS
jgi:hypothetical protein